MSKPENNRVLSRRGARVVTTEEADAVQGASALPTDTVCTYKGSAADGDTFLGEC